MSRVEGDLLGVTMKDTQELMARFAMMCMNVSNVDRHEQLTDTVRVGAVSRS